MCLHLRPGVMSSSHTESKTRDVLCRLHGHWPLAPFCYWKHNITSVLHLFPSLVTPMNETVQSTHKQVKCHNSKLYWEQILDLKFTIKRWKYEKLQIVFYLLLFIEKNVRGHMIRQSCNREKKIYRICQNAKWEMLNQRITTHWCHCPIW